MAESDYLPQPGGWYDTATRRWVTPQDRLRQVQNSALGGSGMDPQVAEYMKLLGGDPNYSAEKAPQPQGVPPVKLGRFTVPSWLTDAVVGGVADTPLPGNLRGGHGFAAGALQGFAGKRMGQVQAAQAESEAKRKEYDERQKAAKRLHELAGTQVMKARGEVAEPDKPNYAYVVADTPEKVAAIERQFPHMKGKIPPGGVFARSELFNPPSGPSPYLGLAERTSIRGSVNTLSDNVRQDPDVKDFVTVRDQYRIAKKATASGSSMGDIIAMRAIARASDPQTGVREEEFRTFQGAVGALDALGIRLGPELIGKGKLNAKGRARLLQELKNIYTNKLEAHRAAMESYRKQAEYLGVDPDVIFRRYDFKNDLDEEDPFERTQAEADAAKPGRPR